MINSLYRISLRRRKAKFIIHQLYRTCDGSNTHRFIYIICPTSTGRKHQTPVICRITICQSSVYEYRECRKRKQKMHLRNFYKWFRILVGYTFVSQPLLINFQLLLIFHEIYI
uniref:Ovule protein n=1 Tax=Heterorhabditis bacteriophora TaxID=37862 RepID=A0A1I7WB54_HETBA